MAYSKHIFMFPFTCSFDGNDILKAFKKMKFSTDGLWERVVLTRDDDRKEDIYNEKNYFYPFAHDILYDTDNSNMESHIRHFERQEPKDLNKTVTFNIVSKTETYTLQVKKMHLNLYSTGVGVLSIFANNYDYPNKQQILNINQFGRRLFPPYKADILFHTETPISLSINGLDKSYCIEYTNINKNWEPNVPAQFITDIIEQASTSIKDIRPIHDDRMFVMSWYKYAEKDWTSDKGYKELLEDSESFLYQYIFIDTHGPSCENKMMKEKVLTESVYARWQGEGTLYGASRYSFVMLTTPECPPFLLRYFETEYERMAEMVLVQRASILRFSGLIKEALNNNGRGFKNYYKQYISFLNRFRLPEISAQDQAVELYDLLCQKIRIKENAESLDNQFNELQEFLELRNQRGLNMLAAWAVPASLVTAIFTFFFHDQYDTGTLPFLPVHSGMMWFIATIVMTIVFIFVIGRNNK